MKKTDIIETKSGKVQGYVEDDLKIFKGIPFTAPPIGELRFSPPEEIEPWNNVFEANKFGPNPHQGYTALERLFGGLEQVSEADCLTLNIWTPNTDNKKRPVMVWIYGGAFIMGGSGQPLYEGNVLTKRGDIVLASLNYRVGSLGFLNSPGVTANIGLLDQIAGLKWIKENIEKFGGDPDNITIFGGSAGGVSVITLMAMPAAKGLFNRVISQSAPVLDPKPPTRSSQEIFNQLGLKEGDIDTLKEIPPEKIIDAQNRVYRKFEKEGTTGLMDFRPTIDKDTLPMHPWKAIKNGEAKDIDLIIGCTQDEYNMFTSMNPRFKIVEEKFPNLIYALLSRLDIDRDKSLEILEVYKKAMNTTNLYKILNAIGTDFMFRISEIRIAEAQQLYNKNTYNFIFGWPSPFLNGKLGSVHMLELPYVFGKLDLPKVGAFFGKGPDAIKVSENMMDSWLAYSRTGNPSHKNIPKWEPYDLETRSTMLITKESQLVEKYRDQERAAWDGLFNF